MRNVIRFVLAAAVIGGLVAVAFLAGFGSGYLLADGSPLVAGPKTSATTTPTTPPTVETATATPEPTSSPTPIATRTADQEEDFQLFWEVWDLVRRDFYGDIPDTQEVTYAAIRGMLGTLDDDYTVFVEPETAAVLGEDATGEFEGIGAFVGLDDDGKLEIVVPFEGGPADSAGLLAGDRVLAVDGEPLSGKSLYESINLIRGPANSQVTLLVQRQGVPEPFAVAVIRARLEIPITVVEIRDDGIGYIRLHEFSATADRLVAEGLKELLEQEPQGIVLDLRQNPGGWLDQAVAVADLFLDEGVVLTERWSDGSEQVFKSRSGDLAESIPLVVLVDRGSASASEIVAGALQDRERAVLVGETTFGKGSVQRPFTLSDGSELRVTTALWFTPNDQAIHGAGLVPDIEVLRPERDGGDPDQNVDTQLERAAEYLRFGD
jgi:carboxyl-terminal processing protease